MSHTIIEIRLLKVLEEYERAVTVKHILPQFGGQDPIYIERTLMDLGKKGQVLVSGLARPFKFRLGLKGGTRLKRHVAKHRKELLEERGRKEVAKSRTTTDLKNIRRLAKDVLAGEYDSTDTHELAELIMGLDKKLVAGAKLPIDWRR